MEFFYSYTCGNTANWGNREIKIREKLWMTVEFRNCYLFVMEGTLLLYFHRAWRGTG